MMAQLFQKSHYSLAPSEGKQLQALGSLFTLKATTEQTNGAFNLFEITCPPGYETPLQIHYVEDVAIYVLEGTLTFFWGSEKKEASAGSYFYQARYTPHGFRVEGPSPARILYMAFPGGIDQFIVEQGQPNRNYECMTEAARYKIEILGPLPE
jgi:quercetin dioxygenase-like cupin family protein